MEVSLFLIGEYDCLNISLGDSKGENWWCMMFPPLCLNDSSVSINDTSKKTLSSSLEEESYNVISSDSKPYIIKFKVLEIFNSLK